MGPGMRQPLLGLFVALAASASALCAIGAVCLSSAARAQPPSELSLPQPSASSEDAEKAPRAGRTDPRELLRNDHPATVRRAVPGNAADRLVAQALKAEDHGHTPRARALLRRALSIAPGHPGAHLLQGAILQLDGDVAGARAEYEQYLRLDPDGEWANELHRVLPNLAR